MRKKKIRVHHLNSEPRLAVVLRRATLAPSSVFVCCVLVVVARCARTRSCAMAAYRAMMVALRHQSAHAGAAAIPVYSSVHALALGGMLAPSGGEQRRRARDARPWRWSTALGHVAGAGLAGWALSNAGNAAFCQPSSSEEQPSQASDSAKEEGGACVRARTASETRQTQTETERRTDRETRQRQIEKVK